MQLADDLPAAWDAPTADTRTKQRLIHILIREIVCDVDDTAKVVVLLIDWTGGRLGDIVVKDPNREVQDRLALVFEMFSKFRIAAKVMRVLNARGLDLPRRDRHGDLRWAGATVSSV